MEEQAWGLEEQQASSDVEVRKIAGDAFNFLRRNRTAALRAEEIGLHMLRLTSREAIALWPELARISWYTENGHSISDRQKSGSVAMPSHRVLQPKHYRNEATRLSPVSVSGNTEGTHIGLRRVVLMEA